jgi:flagellar motility protein MotE (MotC chaperone)
VKLPQLRDVRLLPVVIAATCALLLLKGLGIMTTGGYVLTGTSSAEAAGAAPSGGASGRSSETTMAMPVEPTLTDIGPVLHDNAPTLPLRAEEAAGGHGAEADGHAGASSHAASATTPHGDAAPGGHAAPGERNATSACPSPHNDDDHHGAAADHLEGFDFIKEREDCVIDPGVNAAGDALPSIKDGAGNIVPLADVAGPPRSENALLERLAERRTVLETREAELDMRMALVEAAEKRIKERTAVLEALEARINAMVDEKRTLEEAQFVAVVSMYEMMKPKDAAAIFDQLDTSVLLRVARAMNPRKMAPIMAKMAPSRAQELTAAMAVDRVEPTIELTGEDLDALPQIVGE